MSASTSSGSGAAAPTADDLIKNLIDSVTPTSSSPAPAATTSAPSAKVTVTATPTPTVAPATVATVAPSDEKSTSSTADTKSPATSGGGVTTGLSIALAVGAVVVVAVVVLLFRQRKRRRLSAPTRRNDDNDLGTPQFSIELPRPPPLDASASSSHMRRPSEQRLSVFSSIQNGGESVFTAAGEVSPGDYYSNTAPPQQQHHRVSTHPQTGPVSTTFRLDSSTSNVVPAFRPAATTTTSFHPVTDSIKTNTLARIVSGRVIDDCESDDAAVQRVRSKPEGNMVVSRDTTSSTASVNSLHDSTCGDYYAHGDGLGRVKHPSIVAEDDESSSRSNTSVASVAAAPTPLAFTSDPTTPAAALAAASAQPPVPAARRPPPPPPPLPPAAAFVKPPPIATSASQLYRPSTESELAFQRLSSVSTASLGSVKRGSTSSSDSANPRAGSMIEINEIVGGDGSDRAKEIEI